MDDTRVTADVDSQTQSQSIEFPKTPQPLIAASTSGTSAIATSAIPDVKSEKPQGQAVSPLTTHGVLACAGRCART